MWFSKFGDFMTFFIMVRFDVGILSCRLVLLLCGEFILYRPVLVCQISRIGPIFNLFFLGDEGNLRSALGKLRSCMPACKPHLENQV